MAEEDYFQLMSRQQKSGHGIHDHGRTPKRVGASGKPKLCRNPGAYGDYSLDGRRGEIQEGYAKISGFDVCLGLVICK